MKTLKLQLLIVMVLVLINTVYPATINTAQTGDWISTSTWTGGVLPIATDDVVVGNNDIITIKVGESFTISDLWLGNNSVINVYGTLTIDSLHINNNATLNVTGLVSILGGASLANNTTLQVNNTGTVNIEGDVTTGNGSDLIVDGSVTIGGDLLGYATVSGDGTVTVAGTIASGITDLGPLPIVLNSFDAFKSENTITVSWQTASEENNDYFTIERAPDGINYETIATIAGAGNSKSLISYSFIDNNPLVGNSYYRLKQTDFDGAHEYFDAVSISYLNEEDLQIAWVPDSKTVTIDASGSMGYAKLQMVNMAGAVVKNVYKLENNLSIDVSNLKRGMYIVSIIGGDARIVEKIMIY